MDKEKLIKNAQMLQQKEAEFLASSHRAGGAKEMCISLIQEMDAEAAAKGKKDARAAKSKKKTPFIPKPEKKA